MNRDLMKKYGMTSRTTPSEFFDILLTEFDKRMSMFDKLLEEEREKDELNRIVECEQCGIDR